MLLKAPPTRCGCDSAWEIIDIANGNRQHTHIEWGKAREDEPALEPDHSNPPDGDMMKRLFALAFFWMLAASSAHAVTPWPATCIQPIALGQTINGNLTTDDCGFYFGS